MAYVSSDGWWVIHEPDEMSLVRGERVIAFQIPEDEPDRPDWAVTLDGFHALPQTTVRHEGDLDPGVIAELRGVPQQALDLRASAGPVGSIPSPAYAISIGQVMLRIAGLETDRIPQPSLRLVGEAIVRAAGYEPVVECLRSGGPARPM